MEKMRDTLHRIDCAMHHPITRGDLASCRCVCPKCGRPATAYQVKADGPGATRYLLCRWPDCEIGQFNLSTEKMVQLINADREKCEAAK